MSMQTKIIAEYAQGGPSFFIPFTADVQQVNQQEEEDQDDDEAARFNHWYEQNVQQELIQHEKNI
jgi:hypothetical protein